MAKIKTIACPDCGWRFVIGTKECKYCGASLVKKEKKDVKK